MSGWRPHISLEEFDGDEVVVRVQARPMHDHEGPRLADQVMGALSRLTADDRSGVVNAQSRRWPTP